MAVAYATTNAACWYSRVLETAPLLFRGMGIFASFTRCDAVPENQTQQNQMHLKF